MGNVFGTLVGSNGESYDLRDIEKCIDKILETLKRELPEEAHTYEVYTHCLIKAEDRIKTKKFSDL